jgi:hypothetical protein
MRISWLPLDRAHAESMRVLRTIVAVAMLLAAAQAAAVEVTSPEGELYAFPSLLDDKGHPIAQSTLVQWFQGGILHVHITHAFHDGKRAEERARFVQGKQLVQRWWSWEERRGDALIRSFEVDFTSGRARARKGEGDREKTWDEKVKVEHGRTFAGIGIPYAVKNLSGRVLRGENVSIRGVSFLPKPVSIRLGVKHAGRDRIGVAGRQVDADLFEVRPDKKMLKTLLKLLKDTTGADVWLHHGRPPMILRVRYPLAEPWDPVVIVETLGTK